MTTTSNDTRAARLAAQDGPDAAYPASPAGIFGELALSWQAIAQQLEGAQAQAFRRFVLSGTPMDKDTANHVGEVVLAWAQSRGATHFAHWFQPLKGGIAEKHDAFLSLRSGVDGAPVALEKLAGALLLQGEPDASSFPHGGLRATHTARGYTVWDPHTPLFIREEGGAPTLCVACAYVSYTGHSLDQKTPLLRALATLSREATRYVNLVSGRDDVKAVTATLGTEQEYFLIDREYLAQRPDLLMTGRTLLGKVPPKNQQLEDQYFGPMPARVLGFMAEAETELYRLGIPVKTRHAEVAPSQYELAPIFEAASVACDHNLITMEVLQRVAERHGLACLLHEKPFAGVNGSGKHNNWSMGTDTGLNLLDPGDNPEESHRFMAILAAVLLAVHRHGDVLRVTVASAGNDHRLGANEAPPPIISAYLGEMIEAMVAAAERGEPAVCKHGDLLPITDHLNVKLDSTDRNRTAPFAFTGNKFEYRAVGSSENCAWPMTVLNAAVAEAFADLSARLEGKLANGKGRHDAVVELVREAIAESRAVTFEGNGYAPEWVVEARRRGLPVLQNTPAALAVLADANATEFLVTTGTFSADEVSARHAILAERYLKVLDIEGAALGDLATVGVLPALEAQIGLTGESLRTLEAAGVKATSRLHGRLARLAELSEALQTLAEKVETERLAMHHGEATVGVHAAADHLVPAMAELRAVCDEAEGLVADHLWPMPKYREMLFPIT